jgi:hypothetical protein
MTTAAVAVVTPEERAEREREGAQLVVQANGLAITDAYSYTAAAAWLRDALVPMKRKIQETFRPRIQQAHALHKGLCDDERRFLSPVEGAERVVKAKLAAWEEAETRRRQEAAAAARREQERLEAEARAQALAVEARLRKEAEDQRIAEAAQLEQRGDQVGATKLLEAPVPVPVVTPAAVFAPVPPVASAPKVEGVSYAETWSAEVTDLALLVKAVAAGEAALTLLQPNTAALNGLARSLKGAMAVPGVRAVSSKTARVRAS